MGELVIGWPMSSDHSSAGRCVGAAPASRHSSEGRGAVASQRDGEQARERPQQAEVVHPGMAREQPRLEKQTRRMVLVFGAVGLVVSLLAFGLYWALRGSWLREHECDAETQDCRGAKHSHD